MELASFDRMHAICYAVRHRLPEGVCLAAVDKSMPPESCNLDAVRGYWVHHGQRQGHCYGCKPSPGWTVLDDGRNAWNMSCSVGVTNAVLHSARMRECKLHDTEAVNHSKRFAFVHLPEPSMLMHAPANFGGEQTLEMLDAAQKAIVNGERRLHCSRAQHGLNSLPADTVTPVVFAGDGRNMHYAPSELAAHSHIHVQGAGSSELWQRRVCGYYTAVANLMQQHPESTFLLNHGAEFSSPWLLIWVERVLRQCGVDPALTIYVHYNHAAFRASLARDLPRTPALERTNLRTAVGIASGEMRGARVHYPFELRQAYWNLYFWRASQKACALGDVHAVCNRQHDRELDHFVQSLSHSQSGRSVPLILGGQEHSWRFPIFLELHRRGILARSRWSYPQSEYCTYGVRTYPIRDSVLNALPLLNDGKLIASFCNHLPKTLDIVLQGSTKMNTTVDAVNPDLWRQCRFALVLETSVHPGREGDITRELTEKVLKPMLNARPFVLLAAQGSLAMLRAYGFQTFNHVINETYDTIGDPRVRLQAAINEVERLESLPSIEWLKLRPTLAYNRRWLLCGELRHTMSALALEAISRSVALAAEQSDPAQAASEKADIKLEGTTRGRLRNPSSPQHTLVDFVIPHSVASAKEAISIIQA
eukprot:CAMPEP_0115871430 /NCGR_PEP_ID=MMETSP0287-20121206/22868_1 /TAXON_ID=412157 /ORGANISM="Chrysochromulina rotalis, Strain UIO044" /LENGTH=647 /DNA_ID=CAMNT_0003326243 /DNA_START=71 /DNA_END=2015 /DNA_ORIENTATION=-